MTPNAKTDPRLRPLRWPLRLTYAGLVLERGFRAFWPFVSLCLVLIAALMLGLQDLLSNDGLLLGFAAALVGLVVSFGWGIWRFSWPSRATALTRLDASLPGRPVSALLDDQAIGATDAGSAALWQAHQLRMARAAAAARAPQPDLNLASADPLSLRYLALVFLLMALVFGSVWRLGSLPVLATGGEATLAGPSWEGWVEPPRYTGLPVLYLNDQTDKALSLPQGTRITLRFYGEVGALGLAETISGPNSRQTDETELEREIEVTQEGRLEITGEGGRSWSVSVLPDNPPSVAFAGMPELTRDGALSLGLSAEDDYGVVGGEVRISLDYLALERRHGLFLDPEERENISLDLPLPLSGARQSFTEYLIEDFGQHPWANLPVIFSVTVQDAAGQSATSSGLGAPLVAPRFFEPLAAAVAEQRRDLLWTRRNAPRLTQVMRALSHRPHEIFREAGSYLQMRTILRRLEAALAVTGQASDPDAMISEDARDEAAAALWALAQSLEDGDIGDALARMQRAKERLSQAMRDGASDEEIARLMQELREATQDYMRQLQRQAQQEGQGDESGEGQENAMTLSQQDLQAMMDRIEELMEQGRMAEAEQALEEFQRMMENMRMTQSQPGEGGSDGQQAMEELGETLREQQGLSDQAFRDLQEQFNPNAQSGESQNNEGRNGGQGRGQEHQGGSGGEGQSGQDGSTGETNPGDFAQGGSEGGSQGEGSLAQRQQALREALRRQQDGLPLGQGQDGEATREALDRAGEAMEGAEEALREGDLAGAIDRQSEAMEALREGMRALGEAMARDQQPGQQQGQGQQATTGQADPLGRDRNASGLGDERYAPLGDGRAHRRAWDLLEELRRRAGQKERAEEERRYFERLLDQF